MAMALRCPGVARESPAALSVCAASKLGREPYFVCRAARPGGQCWRTKGLVVRCQSGAAILKKNDAAEAAAARDGERAAAGFTVVMKFGGSSVASGERMREVADLILSFPEERPVVVLSAMGKTTNSLMLAGEKAVSCGAPKASEIHELAVIKELHLRTIDELGLERSIVSDLQLKRAKHNGKNREKGDQEKKKIRMGEVGEEPGGVDDACRQWLEPRKKELSPSTTPSVAPAAPSRAHLLLLLLTAKGRGDSSGRTMGQPRQELPSPAPDSRCSLSC